MASDHTSTHLSLFNNEDSTNSHGQQNNVITLCHQIVRNNRTTHPKKVIQQIHDRSRDRYKEIKQQKQREIRSRVNPGNTVIDRKKTKKKIDNNASSVASRARREYLNEQLEEHLIKTMNERYAIADNYLRMVRQKENLEAQVIWYKSQLYGNQNIPSRQQQNFIVHHSSTLSNPDDEGYVNVGQSHPAATEQIQYREMHQNISPQFPDVRQESNRVDIGAVNQLFEYTSLMHQDILPLKDKFDVPHDMFDVAARQETLKNGLRPEECTSSNPVA